MKKLLLLIIILIAVTSCKSSKKTQNKKQTPMVVISNEPSTLRTSSTNNTRKKVIKTKDKDTENETTETPRTKAEAITDYAKQFEGVKYKWAGTTKEGMDCSGLVYESFRAFDIILPRISRDIAKLGEEVTLKQVTEGDLLFFRTSNRRNSINHVGLVVSTDDSIKFIHATNSAGVIISNLSEAYWDKAFVEARRIL